MFEGTCCDVLGFPNPRVCLGRQPRWACHSVVYCFGCSMNGCREQREMRRGRRNKEGGKRRGEGRGGEER